MAASSFATLSLVGDRPSLAGGGAALVQIKGYEASTQRGKTQPLSCVTRRPAVVQAPATGVASRPAGRVIGRV
jgi:hypothetical protein